MFSSNRSHQKSLSPPKNANEGSALVKNMIQEIAINDQRGFQQPRTISRMRRIKEHVEKQFKRQYVKNGSQYESILKPPKVSSKPPPLASDVKKIVQQIIKGDYDFEGEETELNRIAMGTLQRSERQQLMSLYKMQKRRQSESVYS